MTRGYTDHEQFDDLGIIHMNGRIYDADLGRFLSADPLVPHPYFSQSYNRYSYVRNNPLSLIDPSGFQEDDCFQFGRPQPEPERGCLIAGTCSLTTIRNETPVSGKIVTYQTYPTQQELHYRYQGAMAVRDHDRSNDLGRYNGLRNAAENTWAQSTPAAVAPDVVAGGEIGGGAPSSINAYSDDDRDRQLEAAKKLVGVPYAEKTSQYAGTHYDIHKGMDCGGSIAAVNEAALVDYKYSSSGEFKNNPYYKPVTDEDNLQSMDVGRTNGHLLFYAGRDAEGKVMVYTTTKKGFKLQKLDDYEKYTKRTYDWYTHK